MPLMRSLRVPLAATLAITFFVADHDVLYSTHPFESISPETFAAQMDSGSVQRQVCFGAMAVISALVLLAYRGQQRRISDGMLRWLLLAFVGWCAISVFWTDAAWLTTRRLGVFAIFSLATLAATREFSVKGTLVFASITSAAYLMIGILAEVLLGTFHPFEAGYRFAGTLHPNGQGMNCAVLLLSSMALLHGKRRFTPLLSTGVLAGVLLLLLTGSRTAFASAIVICAIYAIVTTRDRRFIGLMFCLLVSVALLVTLLGGSTVSLSREALLLGREEGTTTFTARVDLWQDLIDYVYHRPILGYGFGAFWSPNHIMDVSSRQHWSVSSSHSEYLEVALDLGCVGLTLYLLILFTVLLRTARVLQSAGDRYIGYYFGLLLFYVLNNVLESHLFSPGLLTFLAMMAVTHLIFRSPDTQQSRVIEGNM